MNKIAIGTILVLETGEYSDKSWHGPFRVDADLDLKEAREKFWSEGGTSPWEFIAWLAKNQFISDIDSTSVHIGSYGQVSFDE